MSNLDKAIAILNRIADPVIRERAIANINNPECQTTYILDGFGESEIKVSQAIRYGFNWDKTKEGGKYWQSVVGSWIPLTKDRKFILSDLKHAFNAGVEASCTFDEWFNEYCKSENEQK